MNYTLHKKNGKQETYPTMLDVLRHAEAGDTITLENGAVKLVPKNLKIGKSR